MCKIKFIPEEFDKVICEFKFAEPNQCTHGSEQQIVNQIIINAPQEIIYNKKKFDAETNELANNFKLPICIYSMITFRQEYKYYDQIDWIVNIRKVDNEEWISGVLSEKVAEGEYLMPSPWEEENRLEEKEKAKDAQKYSEADLQLGTGLCGAINIDLHEYIDLIPEEGEYEIFVSKSGLESNRVRVKITFYD